MTLNLKNFSRLALSVIFVSQVTACTDTEVGLVSGAIIGAVIADSLNDNDRRSHDGHYHPSPGYGSRPGYGRHPGPGYGRGGRDGYYPRAMTRTMAVQNSELVSEADSTEILAERFAITTESASILIAESAKLKAGDSSTLVKLGLTKEELTAMSQGENPSAETLKNFMTILKTDELGAHNIIQALKDKAAEML